MPGPSLSVARCRPIGSSPAGLRSTVRRAASGRRQLVTPASAPGRPSSEGPPSGRERAFLWPSRPRYRRAGGLRHSRRRRGSRAPRPAVGGPVAAGASARGGGGGSGSRCGRAAGSSVGVSLVVDVRATTRCAGASDGPGRSPVGARSVAAQTGSIDVRPSFVGAGAWPARGLVTGCGGGNGARLTRACHYSLRWGVGGTGALAGWCPVGGCAGCWLDVRPGLVGGDGCLGPGRLVVSARVDVRATTRCAGASEERGCSPVGARSAAARGDSSTSGRGSSAATGASARGRRLVVSSPVDVRATTRCAGASDGPGRSPVAPGRRRRECWLVGGRRRSARGRRLVVSSRVDVRATTRCAGASDGPARSPVAVRSAAARGARSSAAAGRSARGRLVVSPRVEARATGGVSPVVGSRAIVAALTRGTDRGARRLSPGRRRREVLELRPRLRGAAGSWSCPGLTRGQRWGDRWAGRSRSATPRRWPRAPNRLSAACETSAAESIAVPAGGGGSGSRCGPGAGASEGVSLVVDVRAIARCAGASDGRGRSPAFAWSAAALRCRIDVRHRFVGAGAASWSSGAGDGGAVAAPDGRRSRAARRRPRTPNRLSAACARARSSRAAPGRLPHRATRRPLFALASPCVPRHGGRPGPCRPRPRPRLLRFAGGPWGSGRRTRRRSGRLARRRAREPARLGRPRRGRPLLPARSGVRPKRVGGRPVRRGLPWPNGLGLQPPRNGRRRPRVRPPDRSPRIGTVRLVGR